MAAKRLHDQLSDEHDPDQPEDRKRLRSLPSFRTVIREAVMAKSLQNFFGALEPLLRRVVQEEVERGLVHGTRMLQRSPQMQIDAGESPTFQLIFRNQLSLPIFTGSKIEGFENSPLHVILVDTRYEERPLVTPQSPIKLEIVVLDGDFPSQGREDWTGEEFERSIVKERTGRRPLLTGDVNLTLREGMASIGELSFTDNSSWIKSQQFRIGARVVPGSHEGPRIKEAMTESFRVKDHRGELYKKNYPPALSDEVWRLEKIGKDGQFHKRLSANNIKTVQDFLRLSAVDQIQLRGILGPGMSDKMWEVTIKHAKTCPIGEKLYIHPGADCTLLLNSIGQVEWILSGNLTLTMNQLNRSQKPYVQEMAREANRNWNKLEEAEGIFRDVPLLQNEDSLSDIQFGGI